MRHSPFGLGGQIRGGCNAKLVRDRCIGTGGGLGWHFTNPASPVNLMGCSFLRFNLDLSITSGTVTMMPLTLGETGMWNCSYDFSVATGTNNVSIGLKTASASCWADTTLGFTPTDRLTFVSRPST
jgi:hypothetical protein